MTIGFVNRLLLRYRPYSV